MLGGMSDSAGRTTVRSMESVTDGPPRQPGEAWARYRLLLQEAQLVRENGRRARRRKAAEQAGQEALGGRTSWTL